jgi:hypothetical protein
MESVENSETMFHPSKCALDNLNSSERGVTSSVVVSCLVGFIYIADIPHRIGSVSYDMLSLWEYRESFFFFYSSLNVPNFLFRSGKSTEHETFHFFFSFFPVQSAWWMSQVVKVLFVV